MTIIYHTKIDLPSQERIRDPPLATVGASNFSGIPRLEFLNDVIGIDLNQLDLELPQGADRGMTFTHAL